MKKSKSKLIVRDLSKSFNKPGKQNLQVLKNINLHLNESELVALIGPSGCGKTTLLDCIAGLIDYDTGKVLVNNNKVSPGKYLSSYMMQDDGLLPWRKVIDNVSLPLEIKGIDKKTAKKKALSLLRKFGLLGFEGYYPSQLSGGMRQRAALARTYLGDHDLMLMDEPFSRLDALTKINLQMWFLDIWQKNRKSVLFVTHDIDEAIFLADRIYVFSPRPGAVVAEYKISIPRPRTHNISTTDQFTYFKKKLLKSLKTA